MKIYIAGSMDARKVLLDRSLVLENLGHKVTSRWLRQSCTAAMDCTDISHSELIAVFVDKPSTSGGYWVEMGIAIGAGLKVAIIGSTTNIFRGLTNHIFYDFDDFLDFLK